MDTDDLERLERIVRSRRMKYVAITMFAVANVLAAVTLWWRYSLPDESAADPALTPGAVVTISAKDLAAAYDHDAIEADLKFGDNVLKVTGPLTGISAGAGTDPVITLGQAYPPLAVTAAFDTQDLDPIAALPVGKSVTVTCRSVTFIGETPALDDCVVG